MSSPEQVIQDGPLKFGPLDGGGEHRRVTWRSLNPSQPALVDGGAQVTGWKAHPTIKGAMVAPLPASIPHGTTLRQLWVNGLPAARPVLYAVNLDGRWPGGLNITAGLPSEPCCAQPCRNPEPPFYPCPACNCTVTNTSDGYDFSQSQVDPSSWHNPMDVEFIFHFPGQWTPWIEPRCLVGNVSGSLVSVVQPCWGDLKQRNLGPSKQQMRSLPPPAAIENVLGNFTAPGSFYYDRAAATIAYIPRSPEETRTVLEHAAFTSKEETLLEVNATQNLVWEGVRPDGHFPLPQSVPHTKVISRCGAGGFSARDVAASQLCEGFRRLARRILGRVWHATGLC